MFILTSLTLPLAAFTAFSRIGVSCLHGPHHGAQKSTSTGWCLDSSITSLTKPCVVVSLTPLSAAAISSPPFCSIFPRLFGPFPVPFRIRWVIRRANAIVSGGVGGLPGHPLDPGHMAGRFEEFHQIVARN